MGINDVTDAFDEWFEPLTGVRTSGAYVNGRWSEGISTALSFSGVVQNATPEDLQVLDGGNRTVDVIKIHSVFQLIPQSDNQTGDIINYDGNTWLVHNVARRKIGNYHKSLAVRQ